MRNTDAMAGNVHGPAAVTDDLGPITRFTSAAAAHRTLVVASGSSVTAYSLG
jgi:hypothetical protein